MCKSIKNELVKPPLKCSDISSCSGDMFNGRRNHQKKNVISSNDTRCKRPLKVKTMGVSIELMTCYFQTLHKPPLTDSEIKTRFENIREPMNRAKCRRKRSSEFFQVASNCFATFPESMSRPGKRQLESKTMGRSTVAKECSFSRIAHAHCPRLWQPGENWS